MAKQRQDWVHYREHVMPKPDVAPGALYEFPIDLPIVRGVSRIELDHFPQGVRRWRVVHGESNRILCDYLPTWCHDIRVIFELLPGRSNRLLFSFWYDTAQDAQVAALQQDGNEKIDILITLVNEGEIF